MICKKMIFVVYVLWWLFWGKLTTIFHLVVMPWKIVGMLFNFNFIQSNKNNNYKKKRSEIKQGYRIQNLSYIEWASLHYCFRMFWKSSDTKFIQK